MKNPKKIKIITMTISLACLVVGIVFAKIFKENDLVLGITFGALLFILAFCAFIDSKANKREKEDEKQKDIEYQKKVFTYFEEIKENDDKIALICDIVNNEYIELSSIMKELDFEFFLDYNEDDSEEIYYELSICSKKIKGKEFYYSSLYFDNYWRLVLHGLSEEKDVSKLTSQDIVDLIIDDINKYVAVKKH